MKANTDRIDVWMIDLDIDRVELDLLSATLAPDEVERTRRFYFPIHRARFAAGRGILRKILGSYLDTSAKEISFRYNEYGKPALAGDHAETLCFNFSHSNATALLAVTQYREVGVDIEEYDVGKGDEAVAGNYFSPHEVACFWAVPASLRPRAFLNCWTRKESYIKARGMGLSIPLNSFDVSLIPGEPAALLRTAVAEDCHNWQLRDLALGEAHVGALTAFGQGWSFQLRRWVHDRESKKSGRV